MARRQPGAADAQSVQAVTFDGGPDPAQDDRTPGPYSAWNVEIVFTADRSNDYETARRFTLAFPRVDPGTPEHDALMVLWRLHDERVLAHYRAVGSSDVGTW